MVQGSTKSPQTAILEL